MLLLPRGDWLTLTADRHSGKLFFWGGGSFQPHAYRFREKLFTLTVWRVTFFLFTEPPTDSVECGDRETGWSDIPDVATPAASRTLSERSRKWPLEQSRYKVFYWSWCQTDKKCKSSGSQWPQNVQNWLCIKSRVKKKRNSVIHYHCICLECVLVCRPAACLITSAEICSCFPSSSSPHGTRNTVLTLFLFTFWLR